MLSWVIDISDLRNHKPSVCATFCHPLGTNTQRYCDVGAVLLGFVGKCACKLMVAQSNILARLTLFMSN